jgi:hypothetical protein
MKRVLIFTFLFFSTAFGAGTHDDDDHHEDHQALINSCTAQMMSYVATANQSTGEYKIPVFSHAEDSEIVDSMKELVKIGKSISDDQAAGLVVDRKQITRLNSILEKTGKIFRKRASMELDLCIDYNESLLKDCTTQKDVERCAKGAEEKPENRHKKDELLAMLRKKLLVSKLAL